MTKIAKARAIGLNHIALEVGDIDQALAFYGKLFGFNLRGQSKTSAFIDLGDQFLALQKGRKQAADDGAAWDLSIYPRAQRPSRSLRKKAWRLRAEKIPRTDISMSEASSLFNPLRESIDRTTADAIERLVGEAPDHRLVRVNILAFAANRNLNEEMVIAGFLHAAKVGIFDMSWNVLCPGCGGVLDSNATLKTVHSEEYFCSNCAEG